MGGTLSVGIPKPQIPTGKIPESVANYPRDIEPESEPFLISFKYFNDKVSELNHGLVKNCHKRFLKDIINIGQCSNVLHFKEYNIDYLPVSFAGEYKKLFKSLPKGTDELKEHKGNSSSRLFYFVERKVLHVIAITQAHLETKKQRR